MSKISKIKSQNRIVAVQRPSRLG